mgnify:CR=1 FL=1
MVDRVYSRKVLKGKRVLLTWHQRRCSVCKRFLSIRERIYCKKCFSIHRNVQIEVSHSECRDIVNYYGICTIREVIECNLPYFMRSLLRRYV